MRKIVLFVLSSICLSVCSQTMRIARNDGSSIVIPVDSIASITFKQQVPESTEALAGQWMLIATPNGTTGADGVAIATTDTIRFTATVADDGASLLCEAPLFYTRSGNTYPARWRLAVEQDEQSKKQRIGWVLSTDAPASDKEFMEPKEKYLEDGFFYWGPADANDTHRYIYLLSENIETQRLEGMTLWSDWMSMTQTNFNFPQNHEIYGIVATSNPYQRGTIVGYFEIWASARITKIK